ncbi:MAG: hypothetical protein R3C30_01350 [Hyphomonadaceae bacterium]
MRRALLAVISVCALAACNPSAPGAQSADNGGGGGLFPDLNGSAYRAEATLTSEDGTTMPIVMIRDGRNMRMEFNAAGSASTLITNGDTGESYIISTQGGRQFAIRASGLNQGGVNNPVDEWQGDLAESATRTGNCSVAGETGAEWTKTTPEDGTDTVCVTQDGIILRATDDGRVAWETTSVQRGSQDAALFRLPDGVQAMDLGNMGEAMNQALEAAKQRGN